MKRALFGLVALICLGLLGCSPKTETPALDNAATDAKKMPGADTPPAAPVADPNAAKRAKTGD